jgi:hypothetical protein
MNLMRWVVLLAMVSFSSLGFCQVELIGPGRFPETRQMSGLSGGSFGVLPNGTPSFRGAMALSTPIAYSLGNWHWAMGVNSTSPTMRFRGFDTDASGQTSSGTGELMVGIPTRAGNLTLSVMPISVHMDENAINLQFTPNQLGPVRWGVGVQDIQESSNTHRPFEPRSSRSPFVVATAQLTEEGYASVGYGSQRFGGIFGNVSQSIGNFKALAEYDTYNWNYGMATRLGDFVGFGHAIEATLFAGYVRGKYATWSLTFTF